MLLISQYFNGFSSLFLDNWASILVLNNFGSFAQKKKVRKNCPSTLISMADFWHWYCLQANFCLQTAYNYVKNISVITPVHRLHYLYETPDTFTRIITSSLHELEIDASDCFNSPNY